MRTLGQNNLSIAVLGVGAVGGFLAALFSRKGISVTCVVKESAAEIISQEGIRVESVSFGDFVVRPRAVTHLDIKPQILFVTTKATTLREALKRIDPNLVEDTFIVPLLNGIEHMETLRLFFGKQVIAASMGSVELKRISPNHIIHSTPSAQIELASDGDIPIDQLTAIAQLISGVGIRTRVLKSEAEVLWGKLVRLNAIACTTSASNQPLGFIRADKYWRDKLEGCVKEAVDVAAREGVEIDSQTVMAQIDSLPAGMGTSMQRDILAGKTSELDAIAGAVVRAAKKHNLECPTIESFITMIQSEGGA